MSVSFEVTEEQQELRDLAHEFADTWRAFRAGRGCCPE